jgi:hypothetical protein
MCERAAARDRARERWRIGEPYVGEELRFGAVASPRYLVSRLVLDPDSDLGLTTRALLGGRVTTVRWHAVPADLGRIKPRAQAFADAWRRWLGPSTLVFTQRSDEGRRALAEAVAQADAFELLLRDVWR